MRSLTIMWLTNVALLSTVVAHAVSFGGGVFFRLAIAVVVAVVAEAVCQRWRGQTVTVQDGSAVLMAMIITVALPAHCPWFLPAFASVSGIVLAKQLYGGLGNNPFNPAMAGYALAFISFPSYFDGWFAQFSFASLWQTVDAVSSPTPLAAQRLAVVVEQPLPLLAIVSAVSGGVLLVLRIADWRLTVAFGLGMGVVGFADLSFLVHGGLVFAAFFVITDPVTAAATPFGRLLYGFLVGALATWLRLHGAHTDGIAFAVLVGNMIAPLCDYPFLRWQRR